MTTDKAAAQGSGLAAWGDDVALHGPDAPKWNGQIEHLIQYLLTVHKRFGNTCITCDLQWGATAMHKKDTLRARVEELELELTAKDQRIAELETALQSKHDAAYELLSTEIADLRAELAAARLKGRG